MKITTKELVIANTVYATYLSAKANLEKINGISSLYKAGNKLGFHIEFSLYPLKMADNEFDEYCKDVDIITPLVEYYSKLVEENKKNLEKLGVTFDEDK